MKQKKNPKQQQKKNPHINKQPTFTSVWFVRGKKRIEAITYDFFESITYDFFQKETHLNLANNFSLQSFKSR